MMFFINSILLACLAGWYFGKRKLGSFLFFAILWIINFHFMMALQP